MGRSGSDTGAPWWVTPAILWVVVALVADQKDEPWLSNSAGLQASLGVSPRRLDDSSRRLEACGCHPAPSKETVQPAPFVVLPPPENSSTPRVSVMVPCYLHVKPCGNVTVPAEGIDIIYPFGWGHYHLAGTKTLAPAISNTEHAFQHYTIIIGIVLFVALIVYKLAQKAVRAKMEAKYMRMKAGVLDSDSDDDRDINDPEKIKEKEAELKKRLDPDSKDFIAPGNIYRLLAVLHPGQIGWYLWLEYAVKAGICAYMQLFLPFKIMKAILGDWVLTGVKSPIWFVENSFLFMTMFASLGSLCHVFQGRCATHIRQGAEANHYVITRYANPMPVTHAAEGLLSAGDLRGAPSWARELGGEYKSLGGYKIEKPELTEGQKRANMLFWTWLSLFLNIAMSIMLQFCMFLKVATFTGAVEGVAVVAVSLYFIFDLDAKVLEDNNKMKLKYRRAIAKLTNEYEIGAPQREPAKWINRTAAGWIWFSHMITPLMLLGLILFAWHNEDLGVHIGGSGLEGTTWD